MLPIAPARLDQLADEAAAAPRRRAHLSLHPGPEAPVQRLFVAAMADSYFRPHRHPERWECALVLRGRFAVLTFDAEGTVLTRTTLGPGAEAEAFELPADVCHAWVALEDRSLFFEVKAGPFRPGISAFPPWAPEEGSAGAGPALRWLRCAQPGDCFPG